MRQGTRDSLLASDESWERREHKIPVPTYKLVQFYGGEKIEGRGKWLQAQRRYCIHIMSDSSNRSYKR